MVLQPYELHLGKHKSVAHSLDVPQAVVAALLLLSAAVGGWASFCLQPYTVESPKHLFLSHLVRHDSSGRVVGSTYELAGMDAVPTERALQHLEHVEYMQGNVSSWQVWHELIASLAQIHRIVHLVLRPQKAESC